MLLVKKCKFFFIYILVEIRLEIRFNNVLDGKILGIVLTDFVEKNYTFFDYKN